jgi:hypothetical protein
MLKQGCKIGCWVLVLGLLGIPAFGLENNGLLSPSALILTHGGDGLADGTGNEASDRAGTSPDNRTDSVPFFKAAGNAEAGSNGSGLRTRNRQQSRQRTPGTEPVKERRMKRTTVRTHK